MPTTREPTAETIPTARALTDSLPGATDGTRQIVLSPSLRSETKAEIERIFDERPPDEHTQWSFVMDRYYGNPIQCCAACGHEKQKHYPYSANRCCPCKEFV